MSFENRIRKVIPKLPRKLARFKYLHIIPDDFSVNMNAGLGDQTYQLKVYLLLAHTLQLALVLPERNLPGQHNLGKKIKLNWHEYYDFDRSSCLGSPIKYVDSIRNLELEKVLNISHLIKKGNNRRDLLKLTELLDAKMSAFTDNIVALTPSKDITDISYKYNFKSVIWIRRGDRAETVGKADHGLNCQDYDSLTQAENILKKLRKLNAPKNIYVMSDMLKGDPVIDDLNASNYTFTYYYDYPELLSIKGENNYKLFFIEFNIFAEAKFKIFKNFWLKI